MVRAFLASESGATAIEQALLAAFIALAVIAATSLAGRKLFDVYLDLADQIGGGGAGGGSGGGGGSAGGASPGVSGR